MAQPAEQEREVVLASEREELFAARGAMVNVRIGQRSYPAIRNPRCKICTHPARVLIEEKLLLGETYISICTWISDTQHEQVDGTLITWPKISKQTLINHYNAGHCPVDTAMLKEFTDQRSAELGQAYTEAMPRIVDHVTALRHVVARGQERLVKGEMDIGPREMIAAAKALTALELATRAKEASEDQSAYEEAFEVYFTTARRLMSEDQWQAFSHALATSPVLARLTGTVEAEPGREIIDAEVVG
jgi:hypothetical protein